MKKIVLAIILSLLLVVPLYAADTEVQDLDDITTPASGDDMYIVDDPDGTPASKKISVGALLGVATDLDVGGAISANSVALTTDTTGNYANGDAEAGNATTGDNASSFFQAGVLEHETGGLEADVSAFTGLLAISGGATSEVDAKSELETQIADVSDFAEADGDVYTGTHDFGGADDLEVPNSATPTVDTAGQVALDTTITDHDGLIYYYQGAEIMVIPAIPLADLTTTDGHVIDYNAAGNKFTMDAPAAGGETNSLEVVTTGIATTEIPIGTAPDTVVYAALSGDATMANDGVVTVVDDQHAHTTATLSGIVNADLSGSAAIINANLALTAGRSLTEATNDILADAELYTDVKTVHISRSTGILDTDDLQTIWVAPLACTITKIHSESDQTVNFDFEIDDGTPAGVNGSDIAAGAFATDSSLAGDTTMAAGDRLDLAIASVSGTPTFFSASIEITFDD